MPSMKFVNEKPSYDNRNEHNNSYGIAITTENQGFHRHLRLQQERCSSLPGVVATGRVGSKNFFPVGFMVSLWRSVQRSWYFPNMWVCQKDRFPQSFD